MEVESGSVQIGMVKSQSALRFERFGFAQAKIFWLKALWHHPYLAPWVSGTSYPKKQKNGKKRHRNTGLELDEAYILSFHLRHTLHLSHFTLVTEVGAFA